MRRAWSLKTHLLLFGLLLVVPMAALAAWFFVKISSQTSAELRQRLVHVALGIANEIDRDLERRLTVLQTLATSPALARSDYAIFHSYASAVLREDGAGIFLVEPTSLQQLLNTYVPFGTELPRYGSQETARRVIESKSPQVSNFFIGRVTQRPAFDIAIPVLRDGDVQYVLAMGLEPRMLQQLLVDQNLPVEWVVTVSDREGTVLARSAEQQKHLGSRLPPDLSGQEPRTVQRLRDLEGVTVLRAAASSVLSGWQVAVNVPAAVVDGPLHESLFYLVLFGTAAVFLTLVFASWFGRLMARPIMAAAEAARALANRQPVAPFDSQISEANALMTAVARASEDLRRAEEEQRAAYDKLEMERNRAATLLQQREVIFAALPNGVLVADEDGRIRLLNERLAQKFGYRPGELIGEKVEILIPERFRTHHAALRAGFAANPSPRPMGAGRDLYGLRKDGSEFPIEIGLSPFTMDGRDMVMAIVINISERKRSEKAAAEQAERQAALYTLIERLNRAESFAAVHDAALDAMQEALHCDRASILLADEAGTMRFVRWRGLSDAYREAVDGHSPWTGEEADVAPICIPDVASGALDARLREIVEREGIAALAFIPLVSGGRLIGKFMTYYDRPHVFGSEEMGVSLTIARQLALAIERRRAEESLRESERRLEMALTAGRMGAWEWDIASSRLFWSTSLMQIHGVDPEDFTGTFDEFANDIHPEDAPQVLAEIETALKERRNYHVVYRMLRRDGQLRWLEAFGRVIEEEGVARKMVGVCSDITDRKRAEETERLLTAELRHRTKNLFTVIQAIASRTLRGDASLERARAAFVGRLQALARSYGRLEATASDKADLREIIASETEHFAGRIRLQGADIVLPPQAAQKVALAIHELVTNAAKYGSLSAPGGEVLVSWKVVGNGSEAVLHLRWEERGGPAPTVPRHRGFGTALLESTLGKGRIDYGPGGLVYDVEMHLPRDRSAQNERARPARDESVRPALDAGARPVEDERP